MKKNLAIVLMVFVIFGVIACGEPDRVLTDEEAFFVKVNESKELLNTVADDIYSYWYVAIYEDEYLGNINYAIEQVQSDNGKNIETIKSNDKRIDDIYKKVKEGDLSNEIEEVIRAYKDYYEFVINVSGSFVSYSESRGTKKKQLESALSNLKYKLREIKKHANLD